MVAYHGNRIDRIQSPFQIVFVEGQDHEPHLEKAISAKNA